MESEPGGRIGDYNIEGELRSEPTARVYAGVHVVLPRRVAIKILPPEGMKSHAVQLLREACILEALSHPGIPRIYECGVADDKRPWVAIERIDGTSLAESMSGRSIAVAELVTVIRGVADILAHAHARGVVHRRLGEGFVILTPNRACPLSVRNWGGVVTYDSHRAAEPTSDVYALGALAYRALTASRLTQDASAQAECPEAPADLTHLIDDMLARHPAERPSAAEVCERATWVAETLESATEESLSVSLARAPTVEFAVRIRG
jgi:eukaryotic-like serine/threonine-protein kinase